MHGDDVASAGMEITKETTSEVLQLIIKAVSAVVSNVNENIRQNRAEERQERMLERQMEMYENQNKPFDGMELHGEQKMLSDIKKNGEMVSAKFSREDFEAFKKINAEKFNDEIAYFAAQCSPDSEYVDIYYLKSDENLMKDIGNQIIEDKLKTPEKAYNMTDIPKEKAQTFQEICDSENISVSMMETRDGKIKCIFAGDDTEKIKNAIASTDEMYNNLDKISAEVVQDGNKWKIQINDIEQNKSITMRFGEKEKVERVLQEQFGFDKAKTKAVSSVFEQKLNSEQKRYFNSGNKLMEQVEHLRFELKFNNESLKAEDFRFSEIGVKNNAKDEVNNLFVISDKKGNSLILSGKGEEQNLENVEKKIRETFGLTDKKQVDEMLHNIWESNYVKFAPVEKKGKYSIQRTSQSMAEISLKDESVHIDFTNPKEAKKLLMDTFGMNEKKAEKIINKAANQSVTNNILKNAKAVNPQPDKMISNKKLNRGGRK